MHRHPGLLIGTYNVENLGGQDRAENFNDLARYMGSQDLIAIQEIQDNSGPEDDGFVAADRTFDRLTKAVSDHGGPDYDYVQIDPVDGLDGGQPGGNIRVGYLFDPARLRFSRSQLSGSRIDARIVHGDKVLSLESNPALLGTSDPAFEGCRKPLVAEFWYGDHQIFIINVHLKSKRGDQPLFGEAQPPQRATEAQRTLQVQVVADFVTQLLEKNNNANVIVMGDFNDHEFRSTLEPLRQIGLTNLIDGVPDRERYTYVYNGNAQVLDHVWVSPHLLEIGSPQIQILHINADFAAKARASDHDPILVRLEFNDTAADY